MNAWQTFVDDNGNNLDNDFRFSTLIELDITLNFSRTGFSYNLQLELLTVPVIQNA